MLCDDVESADPPPESVEAITIELCCVLLVLL